MFSLRSRIIKIVPFILCIIVFICSYLYHQSEKTTVDAQSKTISNEYNIQSKLTTKSETTKNDFFTTTESTVPIMQSTENNNETNEGQSATREQKTSFKNAGFCCVDTNEVLFKYREEEKIAPASLTKILTACIAYYYIEPETKFTVGAELDLVNSHSSLCLINKGHVLTLQDLTTGLLMASGNDAAYTIAVNVARKVNINKELSDTQAVSFFCNMMNSFAVRIGMKNSYFTNPDGWDDDFQYTTVMDLIALSKYALTIEPIRDIISCREKYVVFASGQNITWKNSNQLINPDSEYYNKYAVGMKTGTTQKAGNCLIGAFIKNNKTYIGVICGSDTTNNRYKSMNYLFEKYAL